MLTLREEDAEMKTQECKRVRAINFSKLSFAKQPLTTAEAIKDVLPMQWTNEVRSGSAKITMTHPKK